MMNNRIRKLIYPYLKMELKPYQWKYIDSMLDEAYLIERNGEKLISVAPPDYPNYMSLQFSAINGACVNVEGWEYVKEHGEKL